MPRGLIATTKALGNVMLVHGSTRRRQVEIKVWGSFGRLALADAKAADAIGEDVISSTSSPAWALVSTAVVITHHHGHLKQPTDGTIRHNRHHTYRLPCCLL